MPGRGGAGNWQAAQQETEKVQADVEADRSLSSSAAGSIHVVSREQREHAYSGRGGSGNWYSPKELHQNGTFQDLVLGGSPAPQDNNTTNITTTNNNNNSSSSSVTRKLGRGGAGNMTFGVTEDEERALRRCQEEQQKGKDISSHVEATVNATLAEPPKAKLPAGPPTF